MGVRVINQKRHHYLDIEKKIKSGDYIRFGKYAPIVIENPFDKGNGNLSIAADINDFLNKYAPYLVLNILKDRKNKKITFYGSMPLSGKNTNILCCTPVPHVAPEIHELGTIGDELYQLAPRDVQLELTLPKAHMARYRQSEGKKFSVAGRVGYDIKSSLTKATIAQQVLFWSQGVNSERISDFLSPEDAKTILELSGRNSDPSNRLADFVLDSEPSKTRMRGHFKDPTVRERLLDLDQRLSELAARYISDDKYTLYWKGKRSASLEEYSTNRWLVVEDEGWILPYNVSTDSLVPNFLQNLMPEGRDAIKDQAFRAFADSEPNLIGDLCIRKPNSALPPAVATLKYSLADCCISDQVFNGVTKGIGTLYGDRYQNDKLKSETSANRLSGFADKITCNLSIENGEGVLRPAYSGNEFTHIFKMPADKSQANLQTCEWFGMVIAQSAGIPVPQFSLVPNIEQKKELSDPSNEIDLDAIAAMASDMFSTSITDDIVTEPHQAPNYLIERFDISRPGETTLKVGEDFASILGVAPTSKYSVLTEEIAEYLAHESTDWNKDRATLLRLLTTNMLINNSDMHAKNLSMLRTYDSETKQMISNTLSPAYDVVCIDTSVLSGQLASTHRGHAMKLGGTDKFDYQKLIEFAVEYLDFDTQQSKLLIQETATQAVARVQQLRANPPALLSESGSPGKVLSSLCLFVEENYSRYFSKHFDLGDDAVKEVFDSGASEVDDLTITRFL